MEFKLSNELATITQPIAFNYDELHKYLEEQLVKYNGLIISPDAIAEGKNTRAQLNKLKTALDTARKDVKKDYMMPYTEFEEKMKELVGLVDKPIVAIDSQIKLYEQQVKDEKKVEITAYYEANIGDIHEVLTLEKIWADKWLNVTASMKSIKAEIDGSITSFRDGMNVIAGLSSKYEAQIKDKFVQTLDLSTALKEGTRLEEQAAQLEEYERNRAEQKRAEEERRAIAKREAEERHAEAQKIATPEPQTPKTAPEPEHVYASNAPQEVVEQIEFRCWVNADQKAALKKCFIDNKIKVGKVDK